VNSASTPPGGEGRDPPRPRTSFASSLFSRRAARSDPSAAPPEARRADPPSLFPSTASQPAGPSGPQPVEPPSGRNHRPARRRMSQLGPRRGRRPKARPRRQGPARSLAPSSPPLLRRAQLHRRARPDPIWLSRRDSRRASPPHSRPRPGVRCPAPEHRLRRRQPGWCSTPGSPSRRYRVGRSMDSAPR
jgi:hypothetical protein